MPDAKQLWQKQLGVLKDLFAGELNEQQVLEKRRLRTRTYEKWHEQEHFAAEFKRRIKLANHRSQLVIARFAPAAAFKLVALMQSKNAETARKACLDVINHFSRKTKKNNVSKEPPKDEQMPDLPSELASRLLAALANDGK